MTRTATLWFGLFLCWCFVSLLHLPIHPDEAYYWHWSRHLAWSYFDGPPMIAYLIRAAVTLFGTHTWVIKLVGSSCLLLSAIMTYLLARDLFSDSIAERSLLLFALTPVIQLLSVTTTLDAPLLLCWTSALLTTWRWLQTQRVTWLISTSILIGLGLLSKYPMILLLPSLFLFLLTSTTYRHHLRQAPVYLCALCALLLFSTVIYWNATHHWIGFAFQWHHGTATQHRPQWHFVNAFLTNQLAAANPVFFILLLIGCWRARHQFTEAHRFLLIPFLLPLLFFGYQGMAKHGEMNWTLVAYPSATILLAYFITHFQWYRSYYAGIALSILCFLFLCFPYLTPHLPQRLKPVGRFYGYAPLTQQLNQLPLTGDDIILSDNYQDASLLEFLLPQHPHIYIIDSSARLSAYTEPSQVIRRKIKSGAFSSVIYISYRGTATSPVRHQLLCHTIMHPTHTLPWLTREWLAEQCQPIHSTLSKRP